MSNLLTIGQVLRANATLYPDKIGASDLERSLTFSAWNARACQVGNALLGLGLVPGDRVAVLLYNCLEWLELYVGCAKAGLVVVPINFRLSESEIRATLEDSEARVLITGPDFQGPVATLKRDLAAARLEVILVGGNAKDSGYREYESWLGDRKSDEPPVDVKPDSIWTQLYTSGTTGRPKGVLRSHASYAAFYLINATEFGFQRHDKGLTVMPLCHVNSVFYSFVFTYVGGSICVYNRKRFDPEHMLRTLAQEEITFTSLTPTHYTLLQDVPKPSQGKLDLHYVRKLLISSAPARRETKLRILEQFPNSELFEAYGSTEAGIVTLLRPEQQFDHLGSIGREVIGTMPIRLLDDQGVPVPEGEVGEIYTHTPMTFSGYFKLPDRTEQAFKDGYCSVGDMARRDPQGFYYLVDRKHNLIITGGEKLYPSEVEALLASHPAVKDVAVIGLPDEKWGEAVTAAVVLARGEQVSAEALIDFCTNRIARYKQPKRVLFIADADMPRTATGKVLHRVLRERLSAQHERKRS